MNDNLFSIGDVSRILGITRKIILNYETCGLVAPDVKNGINGNRYYTIDTITKIRIIRLFQSYGLALPEIREYFTGSTDLISLVHRLEAIRDRLNDNINSLYERIATSVKYPRLQFQHKLFVQEERYQIIFRKKLTF